MEAFEDFVWLRVVALSGRGIISVRVPRQISGEEIYDVAGSGFADGFSFKLLYEDRLLQRDVEQPLRGDAVVTLAAGHHSNLPSHSLLQDGGGVINLVRYGRHLLALSILEAKQEPVDPELLSWCAYTCGGAGPGGRPSGRARPGALRLLFYVLRRWPEQVRQREEGTGKLALHAAAWGWAPVEAAVLLTAANVKALEDRRNEAREAPHELGRYVHGRRFNWPEAAEMKARAERLRSEGRLMGRLRLLRRQREVGLEAQLAGALRLGLSASYSVARCLTASADLIHVGLTFATVLRLCAQPAPPAPRVASAPAPCVPAAPAPAAPAAPPKPRSRRPVVAVHRPPVVAVRRPPVGPAPVPADVELLRHFVRDSGTYAGAHRVRNRRCSFVQVAEVQVGERRFRFETHKAQTVHSSLQRKPPAASWPCKSVWQKQRSRERRERQDGLVACQ